VVEGEVVREGKKGKRTMSKNLTSHEYARLLQKAAEVLLAKPEFETPRDYVWLWMGSYWSDKAKFLAAVQAAKPITKKYTSNDVVIHIPCGDDVQLYFDVNRDAVCHKVQEEKWSCEPLLSPEEEASLEVPEIG